MQKCPKINLNIFSIFLKNHPKLDKFNVYFTLINNSQNVHYERVSNVAKFQNSRLGVEILNFCNTIGT